MFYSTFQTTPLVGLRREIDRLFDDTFGQSAQQTGWIPATDIRETEDAWMLAMDVPGVTAENVEVTTDKGVLTVKGRRESAVTDKDKGRWHTIERVHGAFQRSFRLPETAEGNAIEAAYQHGVLAIRIPKTPRPEPRKIRITTPEMKVEPAN
jgi:HSP20 family protein